MNHASVVLDAVAVQYLQFAVAVFGKRVVFIAGELAQEEPLSDERIVGLLHKIVNFNSFLVGTLHNLPARLSELQ